MVVRAPTLLLVLGAQLGAAKPPRISERNVLLPPNCEVQLSVHSDDGCFRFSSDRADLATI
eukprot:6891136-Prymnesium_polylepis.2